MNIEKYQINKSNKYKTLYLGFFDALHKGHINLLQDTKNKAVMTFVNIPRKSLPVYNLQKRVEDLKQIGFKKVYVYDIVAHNISGKEFIEDVLIANGVKKIIVGEDFKFGNDFIDVNTIKKYIEVETIQKNDISTTKIKTLLSEGKMQEANKLLAFNFSIKSNVIKAKQIATKLGYPTANILSLNARYLKQGVYKTYTIVDNVKYDSITFLGNNKTFEDNSYTIETHILGFNQNIYHKKIEVFFIKYLSEIFKFNNIEDLKKHIQNLIDVIKK